MKKIKFIFLSIITLLVFNSCSKSEDATTAPTDPVTDPAVIATIPVITTTPAFTNELTSGPKSGGTITTDGGSPVTARGIVWSLTTNPTLANSKTIDGSGTGTFVSTMTNLAIRTKYYVRAYATNSKGTAYGNSRSITTVDFNADLSAPLMTANISGSQYNFMSPYLYPLTKAVQVLNNGAPTSSPRYLWIQGVTSNTLGSLNEIDLYIPNIKWAPGTYTLTERNSLDGPTYCQAHMILPTGSNADITNGTITVSEFNLTTKRVKGTFSFSYQKLVNGNSTGTFQVTNGTFNYGLDADYFY